MAKKRPRVRQDSAPGVRMERALRAAWLKVYVATNPTHSCPEWHEVDEVLRQGGGKVWRLIAEEMLRLGCMPSAKGG